MTEARDDAIAHTGSRLPEKDPHDAMARFVAAVTFITLLVGFSAFIAWRAASDAREAAQDLKGEVLVNRFVTCHSMSQNPAIDLDDQGPCCQVFVTLKTDLPRLLYRDVRPVTAVLGAVLVGQMMSLGFVFAVGEGVDPTALIQFGVLGVILALAMLGFVSFKPEVNRLVLDKTRVETQRDAMVDTYQREMIPALSRSNEVAGRLADQVVPLLGRNEAVLERAIVLLDRVERKLG